ncbi:MAG: pyridine nucleotide-disulfide oxidoreductase [Alphaproteobacteria bacterium]|nr:pyridine nucleotide-disulfide oxidoreductase [Alphaproteobacteria bacterium]
MRKTTTIIIGAGSAGLAMSRHLTARSVEHLLLERGEVGNSWRTERWDSLRLLTPNWQSRLPGFAYSGPDPDGFRTMPETITFLNDYASSFSAPVRAGVEVACLTQDGEDYRIATNRGEWCSRSVVIATGACNIASVPASASTLSEDIEQVTSLTYRNPDQLRPGGVLIVGASATGVQLAQEIQASGRPVTLAVGEHIRAVRTYRGRDIKWWMDRLGLLDIGLDDVDDLGRVRNLPSMQLIGTPSRASIDLNSLQDMGVRIVGRLGGIEGAQAQFSGALANICRMADLKLNRLLSGIDDWILRMGLENSLPTAEWPTPTRIPQTPDLMLDLRKAGINTVIWATGYRPDYSWLRIPVLDHKGRLRHNGGVVDAPGLYVLGLPFLRRRKSTLIDGVGDDARDLAAHLHTYLNQVSRVA